MGLPLILAGLGAVGAGYKIFSDNSEVKNGTATWDVPWSPKNIDFKVSKEGFKKIAFSNEYTRAGETEECYAASRGGENVFISTEDGVIYDENGRYQTMLSANQFKALRQFEEKVQQEINRPAAADTSVRFGSFGSTSINAEVEREMIEGL